MWSWRVTSDAHTGRPNKLGFGAFKSSELVKKVVKVGDVGRQGMVHKAALLNYLPPGVFVGELYFARIAGKMSHSSHPFFLI